MDLGTLARLKGNVLALSDKVDLNLVTVEELEGGPVVKFFLTKVDSFARVVFYNPLVATLFLQGLLRGSLLGSGLSRRYFHLFSGSRGWGSRSSSARR